MAVVFVCLGVMFFFVVFYVCLCVVVLGFRDCFVLLCFILFLHGGGVACCVLLVVSCVWVCFIITPFCCLRVNVFSSLFLLIFACLL